MSVAAVESAASASQAALAQQAAAVASQQAALIVAQQQVAANSIGERIWTVETDVAPGTYRASQPVSSDCYWAITKSGSGGSDIIKNDIPGGGMPAVTLSVGQDFSNQRCVTFESSDPPPTDRSGERSGPIRSGLRRGGYPAGAPHLISTCRATSQS
jgi:hypothetical protein